MHTIGIIGRPNVGKSTLFNRIAGKRISITDDRPGVTRDRIEVDVTYQGKQFRLVDTAGFDLKEDIIKKEMQDQFFRLLDIADEFVLVVDGKEGLHPLDEIVTKMLFEKGKPFIIAVNKIDTEAKEINTYEFLKLGMPELFPISASHGRLVDELLDRLTEFLPEIPKDQVVEDNSIKIAVIGKPNVGKSSLINAWLGEERVIVTPIAGTTRDSVDTKFKYKDVEYTLIDTAGIRKKSVMFKDPIEKFGYYRSMDAMERADVVVAVIDGEDGVNDRDVKVIADAWELGRPVVIAVNKWDLLEKDNAIARKFQREVAEKLQFLSNPPILFISALNAKNVFKIFDAVNQVYAEYTKRITTAKVNEVLEAALESHQPPTVHNRRLKFYYMTQVATKPPQFVVFVNYAEAVHFSYQRFIVNKLREKLGFEGVPIKLFLRQRKNKGDEEMPVIKKPKATRKATPEKKGHKVRGTPKKKSKDK